MGRGFPVDSDSIFLVPINGEPLRELVDPGPVKRKVEILFVALSVEEEFSVPIFFGGKRNQDASVEFRCAPFYIFPPWFGMGAPGLPEGLHYGCPGEIAVSVPFLDEPVVLLERVHDVYLAVNPACCFF